jgi:hypothetical protein
MKLLDHVLSGFKKHPSGLTEQTLPVLNLEVGFRQTEDFSEQITRPRDSDPTCLSDRYLRGYKMKIKKGTRKITLFRYFLTKLILDESDGLHLDEYLVMNHLWLDFLDESDPSFVEKYGLHFRNSMQLYTQLSGARDFPLKLDLNDEELKYLHSWLGPLVLKPESYFGMKGNRNIRDSFLISFNDSLLPVSIPPKRFVGVGYRDKGNRQKLPFDGTLHWTEYGQYAGELEGALENQTELVEVLGSSSSEKKT